MIVEDSLVGVFFFFEIGIFKRVLLWEILCRKCLKYIGFLIIGWVYR